MTPPHGEQQPYGDYGQQPQNQPYQQGGYGSPGGYGQPGYGIAPIPPPENYLVWAILTTVLCCLPLGIVSIVKSSQVNSLWAQGRWDEARGSAQAAKKWAMWGAIIGGIVYLAVIVFYVLLFAMFAGDLETY